MSKRRTWILLAVLAIPALGPACDPPGGEGTDTVTGEDLVSGGEDTIPGGDILPGEDTPPEGCLEDGDCPGGFCDLEGVCVECLEDGHCSTDLPCTFAACLEGACVTGKVPDGMSCDDGDECTASDTCSDGVCTGLGVPGCGQPEDLDGDGWTLEEGDCDDGDPAVHPEAPELCNGVNDDCDDTTDEGCPGPGTCSADGDCGGGSFCLFEECGTPPGICTEIPEGCPKNLDPVCGCDGQTWGNQCEAWMNGVSVDYEGECEGEPGPCFADGDCPEGDAFCQKAPGDCDGDGVCAPKPQGCYDLWAPVCGCDGITYSNDCYAAAEGVNLAYEGECLVGPGNCWSDEMCPPGEFCLYDGCGAKSGACAGIPQLCPDVWSPVCGCDGVTYSSACVMMAAHQSMAYTGECQTTSGCLSNLDCTSGAFCAMPEGDCDGPGACAPKPQVCPMIFDPVCGCDGQEYSNSCLAASEGVSVDYPGACL